MRLVYTHDEVGNLQPRLVCDPRPSAIVVAEDARERIALRERLEADGYRPVTCPGPTATRCTAAFEGATSVRCPRVDPKTTLVVVDQLAATTALPEAYRAWLPNAEIRTRTS